MLDSTGGSAGDLHSGVIVTIIDAESEIGPRTLFDVRTMFDEPAQPRFWTTNTTVSSVRPALDALYPEAEVVHAGESEGITAVSVTDGPPGAGYQRMATATMTNWLF